MTYTERTTCPKNLGNLVISNRYPMIFVETPLGCRPGSKRRGSVPWPRGNQCCEHGHFGTMKEGDVNHR